MNNQKKRQRILLFTGEGKGKTTAALGTALRASGHGKRIYMISFIKHDSSTGEIAASNNLPNFTIELAGSGFIPSKTDPLFVEHKNAALRALDKAGAILCDPAFDMVILDELCVAVSHGLLDEAAVISVLGKAQEDKIIIITGRGAPQSFIDLADTVSVINCLKHGYTKGIKAQRGVEF